MKNSLRILCFVVPLLAACGHTATNTAADNREQKANSLQNVNDEVSADPASTMQRNLTDSSKRDTGR